jgi:hypothetical protein
MPDRSSLLTFSLVALGMVLTPAGLAVRMATDARR